MSCAQFKEIKLKFVFYPISLYPLQITIEVVFHKQFKPFQNVIRMHSITFAIFLIKSQTTLDDHKKLQHTINILLINANGQLDASTVEMNLKTCI